MPPPLPEVALAALIDNLLAKLEQNKQEKAATDQATGHAQAEIRRCRQGHEGYQAEADGEESLAYEQQVNEIKTDYDKLSASVGPDVQGAAWHHPGDLEKAQASAKQLNDDLLKTQAELNVTQGRLQGALTQVSEIKPAPDKEAPAFKSDGSVFLVDEAAGVIHINLGSDDHVYQGLTFSVYDRTAGIPRDGKPKAQVEVFAIDPQGLGRPGAFLRPQEPHRHRRSHRQSHLGPGPTEPVRRRG